MALELIATIALAGQVVLPPKMDTGVVKEPPKVVLKQDHSIEHKFPYDSPCDNPYQRCPADEKALISDEVALPPHTRVLHQGPDANLTRGNYQRQLSPPQYVRKTNSQAFFCQSGIGYRA